MPTTLKNTARDENQADREHAATAHRRLARHRLSVLILELGLLWSPRSQAATAGGTPPGLPNAAVAYYDFGVAANSSIANQIQTGAPAPRTISGSDIVVANGEDDSHNRRGGW